MDTRTGEIISFEELKKKPVQDQKFFKEVPDIHQHYLEGLNRKERREWYRKNKHLFKDIV